MFVFNEWAIRGIEMVVGVVVGWLASRLALRQPRCLDDVLTGALLFILNIVISSALIFYFKPQWFHLVVPFVVLLCVLGIIYEEKVMYFLDR